MTFTTEQRVERWEHLRAIKNLMGRMSADYTLKKEGQMYEKYWARRADVSLATNEGWYLGAEAVTGYYQALADQIAAQSKLIADIFPNELGDKTPQERNGVGTMDYKPVDTPVVEIAADGKTAKGIWCLRGSHSKILPSGPVAYWEWGWFAADFILEDGAFRIWHLQYFQEVCRPCGHPWYGDENVYPTLPKFAPAADFVFPTPTVSENVRARYGAERPFTPSPRVPEPYETFEETFSYGRKEAE